MKKLKNIIKNVAISFVLIVILLVVLGGGYYLATTYGVKLDESKFVKADAFSTTLFDSSNKEIYCSFSSSKQTICSINDINKHTIDAFVSIEDKRFFSHHGIDYFRIAGAIKNNILHPKNKQGGSTITQQVVKNTQLSSEKTIKRKLKEFKLAKELEKKYSKEQILEIYLNSIYFGNGNYGIYDASKYYFNKTPKELSIAESALLASVINAPSIYDPIAHGETATKRRNLVINLMKNENKISQKEFEEATSQPLKISKSKNKIFNNYISAVISEACSILKVSESKLKNMNLKINTYLNKQAQEYLEHSINNCGLDGKHIASIMLDNSSKSVIAMAGNSTIDILSTYRQPGSLIKPILVYAPAFESGKYSPASIIKDEPISIAGYTPENANKKYLGNVSIRQSLYSSLNIPAVKVLSNVGISYSKSVASKFGIEFTEKDNNLALALGGFYGGTTLKQLCDAYMTFANQGKFSQSKFIDSIYENDNLIYARFTTSYNAVSEETAYLINSCLMDCAKCGTAKRLSSLSYQVASKTGTVGNQNGNTDAYNVCYTTQNTLCTWIGSKNNNMPMTNVSGANYPTAINKSIFENFYAKDYPSNFEKPQHVVEKFIDPVMQEEGVINICDNSTIKDIFIDKFVPEKVSQNIEVNMSIDNFENRKPIIKFDAKRANLYQICRLCGNNLQILQEYKFKNNMVEFEDLSAQSGQIYEYYIISKNNNLSAESNHIKLISN